VGWGVLKEPGPSPEEKFFVPQNDKFGCILTQFLTDRKHGQSLEALGHGFYGSIAKRCLQKQCKKLSKKFMVIPKGRTISLPSPHNTPLVRAHGGHFEHIMS